MLMMLITGSSGPELFAKYSEMAGILLSNALNNKPTESGSHVWNIAKYTFINKMV